MIFGGFSFKIFPVLGEALFKVKIFHFVWFFVHFEELIRWPPGPLWGGLVKISSCFASFHISSNIAKKAKV